MSNTGSKTALAPTSAEYGNLEYALQLSLCSSTARISSAYVVSNPLLSSNFDAKCRENLVLSSWVDSSLLTGVNTEEEVVKRGFVLGSQGDKTGIVVSVGSLKNSVKTKVPSTSTKIVRKALFCKVGVGRSFVAESATIDSKEIPDGYNNEKASPQTEYYHEYYIKNSTQILPMYLIQYEYDPSYEKKTRESPPCENCETSPATIFCTSDKANLCTKCDKSLHESKVASKHIRTPLQKGSFFGSCRHHANEPIKYYCSVCHIPVCVNCKMIGNHSNGESNLHKLVSVTEAYATVIQESNQQDPLFEARLLEITNQISAITSRAKAVEKMGFAIQSQIDEIYRRATEQLRGITRRKMDVLCSDKLELERQSGEYKRLTEFVKYGVEGDPMLFLFGWARQQKVRSELHDFAFFRSDIDVLLDVRVIGGVSVVVDQDPSKGREKQIDSRDNSPHREVVSREVGGMVGNQSPVRQHQNVNSIGLGIPKSSEKRVQRRTSDFFAETLGAFDQFSVSGDDY